MSCRWLLIESSGRVGRVGLGDGSAVLAERRLDESRRHARDLAPAAADLFREYGWTAKSLTGVAVSLGPGSYTGLRVGLMTGKALAFAVGCGLSAVPTFEVIARQTEVAARRVDVLADALKGKLYAQRYERSTSDGVWRAASDLALLDRAAWRQRWSADVAVTGPGATAVTGDLPADAVVVEPAQRVPGLAALMAAAQLHPPIDSRAALTLEPIYLRPSSAEEQWTAR